MACVGGSRARRLECGRTEGSPLAKRTVEKLLRYLQRYDEYVFPGISTALPFPDESFDFVLSHMMLNNFSSESSDPEEIVKTIEMKQLTILESARVLKRTGRAFHVLAGKSDDGMAKYFSAILHPTALKPLAR